MLYKYVDIKTFIICNITFQIASTRFFGRNAKKIKSVTIIHSSTTETVRLPDATDPGMIVHTAVRWEYYFYNILLSILKLYTYTFLKWYEIELKCYEINICKVYVIFKPVYHAS